MNERIKAKIVSFENHLIANYVTVSSEEKYGLIAIILLI